MSQLHTPNMVPFDTTITFQQPAHATYTRMREWTPSHQGSRLLSKQKDGSPRRDFPKLYKAYRKTAAPAYLFGYAGASANSERPVKA